MNESYDLKEPEHFITPILINKNLWKLLERFLSINNFRIEYK